MNAMPRRTGRRRKARVTLPAYDSPTAQLAAHAIAAGLEIAVEIYRTEAGEQTQLRRQRIISPLEQLWKAGALDAGQYGAARCYQRDCDIASTIGPASTLRYEPRMIDGGATGFLLPIEAAAYYLARLGHAQATCGWMAKPLLDWIAVGHLGWREQAKVWWPGVSERELRSEFHRRLRITCNNLKRHYSSR